MIKYEISFLLWCEFLAICGVWHNNAVKTAKYETLDNRGKDFIHELNLVIELKMRKSKVNSWLFTITEKYKIHTPYDDIMAQKMQ